MPTKNQPSVIVSLLDDFHAAVCRVKALERAISAVYEAGVNDSERDGFSQMFQDAISQLEAVEASLEEVKDAVDVSLKLMTMLDERDKRRKAGALPLAKVIKMCDTAKVVSMSS